MPKVYNGQIRNPKQEHFSGIIPTQSLTCVHTVLLLRVLRPGSVSPVWCDT